MTKKYFVNLTVTTGSSVDYEYELSARKQLSEEDIEKIKYDLNNPDIVKKYNIKLISKSHSYANEQEIYIQNIIGVK